jgi:hypothetical protein
LASEKNGVFQTSFDSLGERNLLDDPTDPPQDRILAEAGGIAPLHSLWGTGTYTLL